jgi:hypothetical protein
MRHLDDARTLLDAEERQHRARRSEVLATAADDLLRGLADRERADNATVAALAPRLRDLVIRRKADLRLVAEVLAAVDRTAGHAVHPSRSERVRRTVDVDLLLSAAEADMSLLDPEPLPPPTSQARTMRDGEPGWVARLGAQQAAATNGVGYVEGGSFGNVDRRPLARNARRSGVEI